MGFLQAPWAKKALGRSARGGLMLTRSLILATAAWGLMALPASATREDVREEHAARVASLALSTLELVREVPVGDKAAVLVAIDTATQGADAEIITEALCRLSERRNIDELVGDTPARLERAEGTLARREVREALADSCEIAAMVFVPAGATSTIGRRGKDSNISQGGYGAPGGGGGSGYIPPERRGGR